MEDSTEAVRQTYTTESGFILLVPKPLKILSGNWLAREITKKELKLCNKMYLLARNFSQTEKHGRKHKDFSEWIRAVLVEWDGLKDINVGILSLDSVILSKFLYCCQYRNTVMQSHALALSV